MHTLWTLCGDSVHTLRPDFEEPINVVRASIFACNRYQKYSNVMRASVFACNRFQKLKYHAPSHYRFNGFCGAPIVSQVFCGSTLARSQRETDGLSPKLKALARSGLNTKLLFQVRSWHLTAKFRCHFVSFLVAGPSVFHWRPSSSRWTIKSAFWLRDWPTSRRVISFTLQCHTFNMYSVHFVMSYIQTTHTQRYRCVECPERQIVAKTFISLGASENFRAQTGHELLQVPNICFKEKYDEKASPGNY